MLGDSKHKGSVLMLVSVGFGERENHRRAGVKREPCACDDVKGSRSRG